jgi:predicted DNA-binding transcriptional regulator YafY
LRDVPDGGLEIDYSVEDPSEFLRWTLKWGAEAEVVAPAAVRDEAAALARAIVARYERAASS